MPRRDTLPRPATTWWSDLTTGRCAMAVPIALGADHRVRQKNASVLYR
jgi:hypothetical protein